MAKPAKDTVALAISTLAAAVAIACTVAHSRAELAAEPLVACAPLDRS